jgi:hypothetical protein
MESRLYLVSGFVRIPFIVSIVISELGTPIPVPERLSKDSPEFFDRHTPEWLNRKER